MPPTANGDAIAATDLPDVDGDGIPDVLEVNEESTAVAPPGEAPVATPAPAEAPVVGAANEGLIHTGLAGRCGCVIGTVGGATDPLLPLLAMIAAGTLIWRRRQTRSH